MAASITSAGAVTLKPKNFRLKVLGVQVDVLVTIAFDMKSEDDAVAVQLSAQASGVPVTGEATPAHFSRLPGFREH